MTSDLLSDFYRCPPAASCFNIPAELTPQPKFFRWEGAICYGRRAPAVLNRLGTDDTRSDAPHPLGSTHRCTLEFDPAEVADELRKERYETTSPQKPLWVRRAMRRTYYAMRPFLGLRSRRPLQRLYLKHRRAPSFPSWPVDTSVENLCELLMRRACECSPDRTVPFIWFWPDGAESCVMMTHDVEDSAGLQFCDELMDVDDAFGIPAAFELVPEKRYKIPSGFISNVVCRGFEVNVQDLNHDGLLFHDKAEFLRRAARINHYRLQFGAHGFRSAVMYRNQDWYDQLHFDYDMSVPNVGRFDPQPGGCCTVFPYFIGNLVELPLTTVQDYVLFHILGSFSTDLWKQQVELILRKNGLVSFLIHPDYIVHSRERDVYIELLRFLRRLRADRSLWFALPREVSDWWRQRSAMRLVKTDSAWSICGDGADRARVAYASVDDGQLRYELSSASLTAALHRQQLRTKN